MRRRSEERAWVNTELDQSGVRGCLPVSGRRCGLPLFQCGGRDYTVGEVVEAGWLLGRLEPWMREWQDRWGGGAEPPKVPEAILEERVNAYRYARELISADECDAWLGRLGLEFSDLQGSMGRRLAQERGLDGDGGDGLDAGAGVGSGSGGGPGMSPEVLEWREVDLLLDEVFAEWARRLAERVALAVEAGAGPGVEDGISRCWAELEARHREARAEAGSVTERERLLRQDWMGLTRLELEMVGFDTESAAREASCWVREDGRSLQEMAAANGMACERQELFIADLFPEWKALLMWARPGEVAELAGAETGYRVVRVLRRVEPRLECEAVLQRVQGRLRAALFDGVLERHVRWVTNLEPVE